MCHETGLVGSAFQTPGAHNSSFPGAPPKQPWTEMQKVGTERQAQGALLPATHSVVSFQGPLLGLWLVTISLTQALASHRLGFESEETVAGHDPTASGSRVSQAQLVGEPSITVPFGTSLFLYTKKRIMAALSEYL